MPFNFGFSKAIDPKLTVYCYNVHGSVPEYRENQEGIALSILRESPDLAFLCEFYLSKSKVLDSLLTQHSNYLRFYKKGTNCVFYSKYPIDSIEGVYDKPQRCLTNKINMIIDKDTVTIIGCHLSSSRKNFRLSYLRRCNEADKILKCLSKEQHPVVVMGDMNDISGSYTIERIKSEGMKDAWWEGGCGYGTTYHDKWLRLRLDHILYKNDKLNLQYIKVIDSDLSDHNALVASFAFKN